MEKVVKIQKEDIKEMVNSCVSRLLSESGEQYTCYYKFFCYRALKGGYKNNYGILFLSDNMEYAQAHCSEQYMSLHDIVIYNDCKCLDLGETDISDMENSTCRKYFFDKQYDAIFFYPDNKTTCIALVTRNVYAPQHGGRYSNPLFNKDKIDISTIEFSFFGQDNFSKNVRSGNIYARVSDKLRVIGSITVTFCDNEAELKAFLTNYIVENSIAYKTLLKKIDMGERLYSPRFQLSSEYRKIGLGTAVIEKFISKMGENKHFLLFDGYPIALDFNNSWDAIDKIAKKEGFELIYCDDYYYFYYK